MAGARRIDVHFHLIPQFYADMLSTTLASQVVLDYAPAPDRARRLLSKLRQVQPFLTQVKGYGVYLVPKIEVQISGSFRSIPGVTQQNPPTNDVNSITG